MIYYKNFTMYLESAKISRSFKELKKIFFIFLLLKVSSKQLIAEKRNIYTNVYGFSKPVQNMFFYTLLVFYKNDSKMNVKL